MFNNPSNGSKTFIGFTAIFKFSNEDVIICYEKFR